MSKDTNLSEESFFASNLTKGERNWEEEVEGQLAVDVYQTKNDVVIKAPIAGIDAEELDIAVTNESVAIKGERYDVKEVDTDEYHAQECYWGAFSRSVMLPVECDSEKAEASFKKGILTVRIPKLVKTKTRKIKVKPE